MILPRIYLLRIKIHRRQTHVQVLRQRQPNPATAVLGAVELAAGNPTFGQTLLDQGAEVFVVGVSGAVVAVEARFEGCAGGAGGLVREVYGKGREEGERVQVLDFLEEFEGAVGEFLGGWVEG